MPELLKDIVGSFLRFILASVFGYLVAQGAITNGQAESLLAVLGTGAAALIWSLWQKYRNKLQFFTALELPAAASVQAVNDTIAKATTQENIATALGSETSK